MKFKAGMEVEACRADRGFKGAWSEGMIVLRKKDCCLVLFERGDGDHPLVEEIKYSDLRPRPPPSIVRKWAVGDLVEATESDGSWTAGVVRQVLPAQQYNVEFPDQTKSNNVFHQLDIRVRQDWDNGKWQWHLPLPSPLQDCENGKRHLPLPSRLQETRPTNFMECVHEMEVYAYRRVLLAFHARKILSWKTEPLLTNLRIQLHISNEEYRLELDRLIKT